MKHEKTEQMHGESHCSNCIAAAAITEKVRGLVKSRQTSQGFSGGHAFRVACQQQTPPFVLQS